jgi:Sec-independent protein translocase protein TatA
VLLCRCWPTATSSSAAAAAKEAPPARSVFQRVAKELHAALLAHEEDDDMSHEMLSLHCMAVLTILGMPARSAAMRDYQWGREITRGENGDYTFEAGTPGGSKNDTYCKFLLSGLNTIGQTGLLRPDLVATALDTLHGASSGTGLVFSRTADGESRFGDDRLRKFLKDHGLTVGDLRRRIETDADELGRRGVLSDQDRELVTYVCQHTVTAAEEDYVQRDAASAERPLVRQNAVSDEELTSQRALVEDAATQNQGSAHADHAQQDDREGDTGADEAVPRRGATRIDWVARVAVHTERLYDLVTNDDCHSSKTLIQLNMALAMAANDRLNYEGIHSDEACVVRHAGAACEFMNAMKRRRIE